MRKRITLGTIIVFITYLSLGIFFLSWGVWLYLSGYGTRPARLEYLMIIVGVFLIVVGIIVVLKQVFLSRSEEESKKKHSLSSKT